MMRGDGQRGTLMRRPGASLGRPFESGGFGAWDPWRDMAEMHRRMDDIFSGFFGRGLTQPPIGEWTQPGRGMEPDVDVYDNENEYILHAALPGCKPEDISLDATEDTVMLACEYRSPFEEQSDPDQKQGPTPLKQSRYASAGKYEFSYTFPDEIDPNGIKAEMKNGRLEVRMPKVQVEGRGKPVHIPIQGAGPRIQQTASRPKAVEDTGLRAKKAAQESKRAKGESSQPVPPYSSPP